MDPDYGQIIEEGQMERHATAQEFFQPEAASLGDAEDKRRQLDASGQQFFQQERPVYSQNGFDEPKASGSREEQRYFNAPRPTVSVASDNERKAMGSEQRYQQLTEAAISQNDAGPQEREGTAQEFYNREKAYLAANTGDVSATGTAQEFFKPDEAFRADVSSANKSKRATQQQWLNKDRPSAGQPEDFERKRADTGVDFFNKSELNRSAGGINQGRATPHQDLTDGGEQFMQPSDAEYGRQSTKNDRAATQQKFFENERNVTYGRGDEFNR